MRPYSLRTPPWETTSGGIRVMYGLYGWLLAKGQVAFLNTRFEDKDFVCVYPEIYHGNEAEAQTVVRYLLNEPGVMGMHTPDGSVVRGQTIFGKDDMIYTFSRLFCDYVNEDHVLFLPILNLHLFKDQKKNRTKKCFFVGKGNNSNKHPEYTIPITREFSQNQQNLADFLNECEVMYCYDHVTAMTEIARLCGCRVIMMSDVYTKDEFRSYEPGMNGMSWGKDDGIPVDSDGFRSHYVSLRQIFSKRLDMFIEATQK